MTEYSYFWPGQDIGDALLAPLSANELSDVIYKLFEIGNEYTMSVGGCNIVSCGGVIGGLLGELEVTNPAGTTIRVADGYAIVDGRLYWNDANVDDTVVAPGAGLNWYLVGLRSINANEQVLVAQIGPQADCADLTQPITHNTDFMEVLALVSIDSVSAITIYDCRTFIRNNGYQAMPLIRRQGGSETNWNTYGEASIEVGGDVGGAVVAAECIPLYSVPTFLFLFEALSYFSTNQLIFATPLGTDPSFEVSVGVYNNLHPVSYLYTYDAGNVASAAVNGLVLGSLDGRADANIGAEPHDFFDVVDQSV